MNESFSKDDESIEDSTTNDGEVYQSAAIGHCTILDLDDMVEDNRIEALCKTDFEAPIVIERIDETFTKKRVKDDDTLDSDDDATDLDLDMSMDDDDSFQRFGASVLSHSDNFY